MGRSEPVLSGLHDHTTTGNGPTHQSDARDSELLVSVDVACAGYCFDYPLLPFNPRPTVYRLGADGSNAFSVPIF